MIEDVLEERLEDGSTAMMMDDCVPCFELSEELDRTEFVVLEVLLITLFMEELEVIEAEKLLLDEGGAVERSDDTLDDANDEIDVEDDEPPQHDHPDERQHAYDPGIVALQSWIICSGSHRTDDEELDDVSLLTEDDEESAELSTEDADDAFETDDADDALETDDVDAEVVAEELIADDADDGADEGVPLDVTLEFALELEDAQSLLTEHSIGPVPQLSTHSRSPVYACVTHSECIVGAHESGSLPQGHVHFPSQRIGEAR